MVTTDRSSQNWVVVLLPVKIFYEYTRNNLVLKRRNIFFTLFDLIDSCNSRSQLCPYNPQQHLESIPERHKIWWKFHNTLCKMDLEPGIATFLHIIKEWHTQLRTKYRLHISQQ